MLAIPSTDTERWTQAVLDYLEAFESLGAFESALRTFWFAFLLSALILVVGRLAKWPQAHLALPFLAWALKMNQEQWHWWAVGHIPHATFFIAHFLEGAIALVIVLALVTLAVATSSSQPASRLDRMCGLSSLLAVTTVIVDWALMMLFIVPWPG